MNSSDLLCAATLAAALGSGLIAGVFFTFSSFVMKALGRLAPPHGIAAMRSINVAVLNPWFLGVFLGTAAVCLPLLIVALLRWQAPGSAWLLGGSLSYLIGGVVVTGAFNVPRNNALAAVDSSSAAGAELWRAYLSQWTAWNHVRMAATFTASAAFILAL